MNLSDGDVDVPTLASLSKSKKTIPYTIRRKKKGMHRKKERKMPCTIR
jgi:hypothetical protein